MPKIVEIESQPVNGPALPPLLSLSFSLSLSHSLTHSLTHSPPLFLPPSVPLSLTHFLTPSLSPSPSIPPLPFSISLHVRPRPCRGDDRPRSGPIRIGPVCPARPGPVALYPPHRLGDPLPMRPRARLGVLCRPFRAARYSFLLLQRVAVSCVARLSLLSSCCASVLCF